VILRSLEEVDEERYRAESACETDILPGY
jgi:hypothetical protein